MSAGLLLLFVNKMVHVDSCVKSNILIVDGLIEDDIVSLARA